MTFARFLFTGEIPSHCVNNLHRSAQQMRTFAMITFDQKIGCDDGREHCHPFDRSKIITGISNVVTIYINIFLVSFFGKLIFFGRKYTLRFTHLVQTGVQRLELAFIRCWYPYILTLGFSIIHVHHNSYLRSVMFYPPKVYPLEVVTLLVFPFEIWTPSVFSLRGHLRVSFTFLPFHKRCFFQNPF